MDIKLTIQNMCEKILSAAAAAFNRIYSINFSAANPWVAKETLVSIL